MKRLTTTLLTLGLLLGYGQAQTAESKKAPVTPKPKSAAKPKAPAKPVLPAIKPTLANVPYGSDPSQVVDFYKSSSDKPAPLMFFIHGGGWNGGSKDRVSGLKECLDAGLAVVSVEYRFVPKAHRRRHQARPSNGRWRMQPAPCNSSAAKPPNGISTPPASVLAAAAPEPAAACGLPSTTTWPTRRAPTPLLVSPRASPAPLSWVHRPRLTRSR